MNILENILLYICWCEMPPLSESHWDTLQSPVLVQEPDVKLEACHSHLSAQVWLGSPAVPRLVSALPDAKGEPGPACGSEPAEGQSSATAPLTQDNLPPLTQLPAHTQQVTRQKNKRVTTVWQTGWAPLSLSTPCSGGSGSPVSSTRGATRAHPAFLQMSPGACTLLACKSEPVVTNVVQHIDCVQDYDSRTSWSAIPWSIQTPLSHSVSTIQWYAQW